MANPPLAEKRHQQDHESQNFRNDEDGEDLAVAGEELGELVQAAEGPFRPGGGVGLGGVGRGARGDARAIAGNSMLQ